MDPRLYHPTIKFTAEISATEISLLDTCIYKGDGFRSESFLDVRTHFKPTESFQYMMYTHFSSCHSPGVKKGLLRTNSSKRTFEESIKLFNQRLRVRGYPDNLIADTTLSEVKYEERMSALKK